jgi:phosphomannomutase
VQTIYLFDVDGTLTDPRQEIDDIFAGVFLDWVEEKNPIVYLVSGSDIKKIKQQIFDALLDTCAGIFACSGNQLWAQEQLIYQNKFRLPRGLLTDLKIYLDMGAQYKIRTGNHIERRPGMINFSVLGRNANLLQREAYSKWEKNTKEREDIVTYITENYPMLDAAIGGAISVDIYPVGKDKSQVVKYLKEKHGPDLSFVFVGDRCVPGGNDWPLALVLEEEEHGHWIQVNSYHETRAIIEHSKLFIGEAGV